MAKAVPKKEKADIFDKAAKLSLKAKAAIVVISFLVIGGAFYALAYMPYSEEMTKAKSRSTSIQQDIVKHGDMLKKHAAVTEKSESIEAAYQYMQRYLPLENEMPQLVQMVSEIGARAGLSDGVTLFAPKLPAIVQTNYAEIPFTMNLQGEFLTVLTFLYDFSRMNRIVNITTVDIGSPTMVDSTREIFHIAVKCTGSTYRTLTDAEIAAQNSADTDDKKTRSRRR